MANLFKNFLNGLNLTDDDDFDDDDESYSYNNSNKSKYDEEDNDDTPVVNKRKPLRSRETTDTVYDDEEEAEQPKPVKQPKKYGKVVHMKSISGGSNMELRVIHPKEYEDSKEISDTLSGGMPVVLNLEGINVDLAQRILDFSSGAIYAMNGNLQKVTSYIFVITPNSVSISGNFDEMLDGGVDLSGNSKYVFRD